ncbi:MAG: hypothetical protein LBQ43_00105 [Holosporales bacterium]|jgi:hypothetical protein|nr:hypothetical protein [Holosporales bacterium]
MFSKRISHHKKDTKNLTLPQFITPLRTPKIADNKLNSGKLLSVKKLRNLLGIGHIAKVLSLATLFTPSWSSILPVIINEDNVRLLVSVLQVGQKNQAVTSTLSQLCRNGFIAGDSTRQNAVDNLLATSREFEPDYDTVSDHIFAIFGNEELTKEFVKYLPHILYSKKFIEYCTSQPDTNFKLTTLGFDPLLTYSQAVDLFKKVGHLPVNETYVIELYGLLSFGTTNATLQKICRDCLDVGRNLPRSVSDKVDQLLDVLPDNCLSYGALFTKVRNICLDQSNFDARLAVLKEEIDKTENRTKLLTSVLLKVASQEKKTQVTAAVDKCLKVKSTLKDPSDPLQVATNKEKMETEVAALMEIFPKFPPNRATLTSCIVDVCDNPDAFYAKIEALQQSMSTSIDNSVLLAMGFTRFDEVVLAMDDCLGPSKNTAKLKEICYTYPIANQGALVSTCAGGGGVNEKVTALSKLFPSSPTTKTGRIAHVLSRLICKEIQSLLTDAFINNCLAVPATVTAKMQSTPYTPTTVEEEMAKITDSIGASVSTFLAGKMKLLLDDEKFEESFTTLRNSLGY